MQTNTQMPHLRIAAEALRMHHALRQTKAAAVADGGPVECAIHDEIKGGAPAVLTVDDGVPGGPRLVRAPDGQYVLHAGPGVVLQLHGEHWAPVYLPALAPYLVHDLTPRAGQHGYPVGAVVRLPEGHRGRLAKYEQRLGAARSPSAVAPCEGPALGRELRHDEREGNEGHVWRYAVDSGVVCVRCRCLGGIKPLTAELAFPEWEHDPHLWCRPQAAKDLGLGLVTCSLGDADDRRRAQENLTAYLTGGFGRQVYMTSPQSRRAILQRASSDFDVGGRWQLPDDVTPETAGEEERPHWLDLGGLLLGSAAYLGADADETMVWAAWLDGDEAEAPPREQLTARRCGRSCKADVTSSPMSLRRSVRREVSWVSIFERSR